jgi:DNA-binding XRE family transcriptional regulator
MLELSVFAEILCGRRRASLYAPSMAEQKGFAYETPEGTSAALRAGRAFMGLSQAQLAEMIGVQEATIGRHENGQNMPDNMWARAYLLERVADAGCPRRVLGLPEFELSLLTSERLPVDADLLAAYLRAQAEHAERRGDEAEPSEDG